MGIGWFGWLLVVLLFLVQLFLILVVLVQRGRGGGLAGALGGMGGQSAFGAKAGDVFTRVTIVTAAIWIFLCWASLEYFNSRNSGLGAGLGSQADQVDTTSDPAVGADVDPMANSSEGQAAPAAAGQDGGTEPSTPETTGPEMTVPETGAPAPDSDATSEPSGGAGDDSAGSPPSE